MHDENMFMKRKRKAWQLVKDCCNYTNGGTKPTLMTEIFIPLAINLVKRMPFTIFNRILLDNFPFNTLKLLEMLSTSFYLLRADIKFFLKSDFRERLFSNFLFFLEITFSSSFSLSLWRRWLKSTSRNLISLTGIYHRLGSVIALYWHFVVILKKFLATEQYIQFLLHFFSDLWFANLRASVDECDEGKGDTSLNLYNFVLFLYVLIWF